MMQMQIKGSCIQRQRQEVSSVWFFIIKFVLRGHFQEREVKIHQWKRRVKGVLMKGCK